MATDDFTDDKIEEGARQPSSHDCEAWQTSEHLVRRRRRYGRVSAGGITLMKYVVTLRRHETVRRRTPLLHDNGPLDLLGVEQAAARNVAEINLLGSIISKPSLIATAEAEGINAEMFRDDDNATIWLACGIARDRDTLAACRIARFGLQQIHAWDPDRNSSPERCGRWSNESLSALAGSWFASAAIAQMNAVKLLSINRRQAEAAEYLRRAAELMTEAA